MDFPAKPTNPGSQRREPDERRILSPLHPSGRRGYSAAVLAGLLLLGGHSSTTAHLGAVPPKPDRPNTSRGLDGGHPLFLTPPPPARSDPALIDARTTGEIVNVADRTFGIPATVLDAYQRAADTLGRIAPACHLSWPVLAGIGQVESGHADGGYVDAHGNALEPILGPELNGTGDTTAISNTFGQRWNQAGPWVRAVGPMQFLPSSWATWGTDGNNDAAADPQNVYDAALAAAHYLCAGGRDLATADGLRAAILSYNNSERYLQVVLQWISAYAHGAQPIPDAQSAHHNRTVVYDRHTDQPPPPPAPEPAAQPGSEPAPQPSPQPSRSQSTSRESSNVSTGSRQPVVQSPAPAAAVPTTRPPLGNTAPAPGTLPGASLPSVPPIAGTL